MNDDLNNTMHQPFRSLNPIDEESAFDLVAPAFVNCAMTMNPEDPGAGFVRNPLVKLRAGISLVELNLHRLSFNEWRR